MSVITIPLVDLSSAVAAQARARVVTFGEDYARLHIVNSTRSLDRALTTGDVTDAAIVLALLREIVRALDATYGGDR